MKDIKPNYDLSALEASDIILASKDKYEINDILMRLMQFFYFAVL